MTMRMNYGKAAPGVYDAMDALEGYLGSCGLDERLMHFMRLRASQINGCAYCIDMHWKDLRALGEIEQRLYGLDAWEESPYYTDKERAAFLWTEAVTVIADERVPDRVFDQVRPLFTDRELSDLTLAIAAINAWNRLSIAARLTPGTDKPKGA